MGKWDDKHTGKMALVGSTLYIKKLDLPETKWSVFADIPFGSSVAYTSIGSKFVAEDAVDKHSATIYIHCLREEGKDFWTTRNCIVTGWGLSIKFEEFAHMRLFKY